MIRWDHADKDDSGTRDDQERAAALAAFKQRQRPPERTHGPRPNSGTDPVGVLAAAVLGLAVLMGVGAILMETGHDVLGAIALLLRAICGLVALVSAIAAGVEWGMRRSRP